MGKPISSARRSNRCRDGQLLAAYRYLARNPVEAGLVEDPSDWPWSSAAAHARLKRPQIPLAERDVRVSTPWRLAPQFLSQIARANTTTGICRLIDKSIR
jgi:hypothetical protein